MIEHSRIRLGVHVWLRSYTWLRLIVRDQTVCPWISQTLSGGARNPSRLVLGVQTVLVFLSAGYVCSSLTRQHHRRAHDSHLKYTWRHMTSNTCEYRWPTIPTETAFLVGVQFILPDFPDYCNSFKHFDCIKTPFSPVLLHSQWQGRFLVSCHAVPERPGEAPLSCCAYRRWHMSWTHTVPAPWSKDTCLEPSTP